MGKGLEALKQYRNQQTGVNVYADDCLDIIEQELKAFEIIKEKRVDIDALISFIAIKPKNALEVYNHFVQASPDSRHLTRKEFDLLKEYLK